MGLNVLDLWWRYAVSNKTIFLSTYQDSDLLSWTPVSIGFIVSLSPSHPPVLIQESIKN